MAHLTDLDDAMSSIRKYVADRFPHLRAARMTIELVDERGNVETLITPIPPPWHQTVEDFPHREHWSRVSPYEQPKEPKR